MPITTSQLKKFRVKELKAIIKSNKLGKVGGNKPTLISKISNHTSNSK